jgi:glycosyltransferase involved in cell wall biosynthesis
MALDYVVITPARNEVAYIELTLKSMVAQTVPPKRWIIVSDGSSDGTDDLVRKYMRHCDWIELVHLSDSRPRSFAAKVHVFNAGYERTRDLDYDVISCLDADISFEKEYFEYLLSKFESSPRLGVAGTHYVEGDFHSFNDSYMNPDHVNGGCQVFRKQCFEAIGGYIPIPGGGVDWVAVTSARMKGWETRSFSDLVFYHHRKIGTAGTNELGSRFRYGKKDYFLGSHPLWELMRGVYQMARRPYLVGGLSMLAGYFWCSLTRHKRPISPELVAFYRGEQMRRLKGLLRRRLDVAR